ncbi:MAG: DciA family protein [Pseudomonadota bacterium]
MKRRRTTPLADLVPGLVGPAFKRRGVAHAPLLLDPADLFGARFAQLAAVERIVWPRGERGQGGTLVVRAHPAAALTLQHVTGQIVERANLMLGPGAIQKVRIVQTGRHPSPPPKAPEPLPDPPADEAALVTISDEKLKASFARLHSRIRRRALTEGQTPP